MTATQITGPAMIWHDAEFKLAINMAGAVSAGAYTAGVLDFLIEALAEWQVRKDKLRAYIANPVGPAPELVPLHDVAIEVFSGASAGGMCAAIASVMLQQEFTAIKTGQEIGTSNTFYEAWVNQISIQELLKNRDIDGQPLRSLLDSTILDTIASKALTPTGAVRRPYVADHLTLFLMLTNLRGVSYRLYNDPNPTVEETIAYYGDHLHFEITDDLTTSNAGAKPLPKGQPGTGAWPLLQTAAKATGAVPLMLAPRVINRETRDYDTPPWTTECTAPPAPLPPTLPSPAPGTLPALIVDGGVTNNNPFARAHDFLAARNPHRVTDGDGSCHNPRPPKEANAAVLTIAPFPASDPYDKDYQPEKESGLWTVLGRLFTVLLSQSRFMGESLQVLTQENGFSQFVIAPADDKAPAGGVLQGGALGAFGGFFHRGFRAHDFLLGRRNCQQFLRKHFCLPVNNPIMMAGQAGSGALAPAILDRWRLADPPKVPVDGAPWLPLIPCTGSTLDDVPLPERAVMSRKELDDIIELIFARARYIKPGLLEGAPGIVGFIFGVALQFSGVLGIKSKLRQTIIDALGPNIGA